MIFNPAYPAITLASPEACLAELQELLGERLMDRPLDVQLGSGIDCLFGAVAQGAHGHFCWWIGDMAHDKFTLEHRHLARMRSAALQRLQALGSITTTTLRLPKTGTTAHLFTVTKLPKWRTQDA